MKRKAVIVLLSILLTAAMIVPSVAWFADYIAARFPTIGGSTASSYFESGNGTPDNPYIITNKVHLYNFAWLQYIGYFNMNPNINNGLTQSYFELKADIDMTDLPIPPIGTTEYPFIGNFDGGGHIISNVTTANSKKLLPTRPTSSKFTINFDEITDLLAEFGGSDAEAGAVIGFFGVVGGTDEYKNGYATDNTFNNDIVEIKNFGLSTYELQSSSEATTVGFVAGYVNAKVSDVLVGNCTLTVPDGAKANEYVPAQTTTNISDHVLIGFATNEVISEISNVMIYDPEVNDYQIFVPVGGGNDGPEEDTDWGGSIKIEDLFNKMSTEYSGGTWVDYAYSAVSIKTADDQSLTFNTSATAGDQLFLKTDNATQSYSVYMTDRYNSTGYYITGGKLTETIEYSYEGEIAQTYYISYQNNGNKNYLSLSAFDGTNIPSITNATSTANATKWFLVPTDGGYYVCADVGGILVYLTADAIMTEKQQTTGSLHVSTFEPSLIWSFSNSSLYAIVNTVTNVMGNLFPTTREGYVSFSDNDWIIDASTAHSNSASCASNNASAPIPTATTNKTMIYDTTNSTYIPLQMEGSSAKLTNTGYITSGIWSNNSSNNNFPQASGDVRLNEMDNTVLDKAFTDASNVYVYNINGSAQAVSLSSNSANLQRFNEIRTVLSNLISYGNISSPKSSYGLHFMNGILNKNITVTIPSAIINQKNYTNYKVPSDCIDFTIQSKGIIAALCGTTYVNDENGEKNNAFFSLHKISRDANLNITDISEIKQIYGNDESFYYIYLLVDENGNEYYEYGDGRDASASDIQQNGYELMFDTSCLTNPQSFTNELAYYFEIPVNAGEYAIGSVENKTGAYLLYLDLCANASSGGEDNTVQGNRTIINEYIEETVDSTRYASGVGVMDIADDSFEFDENEYFSMSLIDGFDGSFSLSRTGNNVTYTTLSSDATINGVGDLTLIAGSATAQNNIESQSTVIKRVTIIDTVEGESTKYLVTYTKVGNADATVTLSIDDGAASNWDITDEVTTIDTEAGELDIEWNNITKIEDALVLSYRFSGSDVNTSFVYDNNQYTVTVKNGDEDAPYTVVDFNVGDECRSATINEDAVVDPNP